MSLGRMRWRRRSKLARPCIKLLRRAEQLAATERGTVAAAELAERFTAEQIQDQDAAAVAVDTARTELKRGPGAVRHRHGGRRRARSGS
jgi:hypothetical protein